MVDLSWHQYHTILSPVTSYRGCQRRDRKMASCVSARHVLAIMNFVGSVCLYMSRLDLSIAIVAMIDDTPSASDVLAVVDRELEERACPAAAAVRDAANETFAVAAAALGNASNSSASPAVARHRGEFDWDPRIRGDVLGAYYYGNAIPQIVAGWLATKYGFKKVQMFA